MKPIEFSSLVLCFILCTSYEVFAQNAFPVSFYPTGEIQTILSQQDCRGIRIYPVFDDQRQTNTMIVIGIDGNGHEINSDSSAVSPYKMYTGVYDDSPTSKTLNRIEAQTLYAAYIAKNDAFVSDVNATLLEGYLTGESLGVSLSYISDNGNNFQVNGFRVDSGLQAFGVPSPGDPCPTACGAREQYLIAPN